MISYEKADACIVFGDGQRVDAVRRVVIPAKLGSTNCCIRVDVISGVLPLLLSVNSMSKARMVLNLDKQSVRFCQNEDEVKFQRTTTGHIIFDILPVDESFLFVTIDELQYKDIAKLHKQFGHCSANKLMDLVKKTGNVCSNVSAMIEDVSKSCEGTRYSNWPGRDYCLC